MQTADGDGNKIYGLQAQSTNDGQAPVFHNQISWGI